MEKYLDYLVSWIKEQVKKANMNGVVIGLSGGLDSSVVAALSKKAFPQNSLGVLLPINNMGQDLIDAQEVAKVTGIKTKLIDLTESFNFLKNVLNVKNKMAIENIKPRLRMTALYALAKENNFLVLGTDNAAEWILGYFTKYGDGGVDLLPLINLTKKQVREAAELLLLPKAIYTKKPSAGLWEGQTDEEELGFLYKDIDNYIEGKKIDKKIRIKIEKQISITKHKRENIPIPKGFYD